MLSLKIDHSTLRDLFKSYWLILYVFIPNPHRFTYNFRYECNISN